MYTNKNIIVIFLFIMLSFAIVSEVSAGSDAKTYGMEFNSSADSVNTTHHYLTDQFDNNHSLVDDDKFQNQHDSFENSSQFDEELNGDLGDGPDNLSIVHDYHDDDKFFDGACPIDFNFTDGDKIQNENMPINFNFSINNPVGDLRDTTLIIVPNSELINNVISNLMGLNNIAPNLRKHDKFDQYVIDSKDKTMFNSQISDIKNTFIPAMDSLTNKDIKPYVKKSIKKYSLKNIMKLLRD